MASIPGGNELRFLARLQRPRRTTLADLAVIFCLVSGFFLLSVQLELAEQVTRWTHTYEHWQLDELPLTLLLLSVGLSWFGWRRSAELRLEMDARRLVEEMNLRMLAQNRQLAQQLIQLQEQERRHLARELHDEIGQCCVAIKVDAALIAQDTHDKTSAMHTSANAIFETAGHLHDVLRGMLHRLRPTGLDDFGLVTCLQIHIESWSARHKIACTLSADGAFHTFNEAINITLYRAVQESLSNIAQHAHATQARIVICTSKHLDDSGYITLSIEDNGIGMPVNKTSHGLGVLGMHERVNALGGHVSLTTAPAGGMSVQVVLPMPNEAATA